MKELRHIRRSRERWQARRSRRAAWWAGQELFSRAQRELAEFGALLMRDEILDAAYPLKVYSYRMHRDYVRKELGLVP
jgi:hypothetical protein